MIKEYSEEEKLRYVRGFKNCTLTPMDYANKMQIKVSDLRRWLREYPNLPSFGIIEMPNVELSLEETKSSTSNKTIMKFENSSIKLELKENFDKSILSNIFEVAIKC